MRQLSVIYEDEDEQHHSDMENIEEVKFAPNKITTKSIEENKQESKVEEEVVGAAANQSSNENVNSVKTLMSEVDLDQHSWDYLNKSGIFIKL